MIKGLDYELLDFGNGRKLERFGEAVLNRPEVLAISSSKFSAKYWAEMAHGTYSDSGEWIKSKKLPDEWHCNYEGQNLRWKARLSPGSFKHVGLFPEQEKHWIFIEKTVKPGMRVLNLFGYTGAASLTAAKSGGDVFHVDSSNSVVKWAADNAELSGISNIHWVCEDALKFSLREVKRNNKYGLIIMDPPVYGMGKKGARWKLEDLLPILLDTARSLLMPQGKLILNTYSPVLELHEKERMIEKVGMNCTESGWLNVKTNEGRTLNLSKYCICQIGN